MKLDRFTRDATVKDFLGQDQIIIQDICNSWLRFEREYGTLGDYDHAIQKVTSRFEELWLFRSQQESKDGTGTVEGKQIPDKKASHGKRESVPDFSEKQRSTKKQNDSGAFTAKQPVDNKSEPDIAVDSSKGEENKTEVDKSVSRNDQEVKGFPPPKSNTYTDECTVFISNLNFRETEEDLQKLFKDIGGVVAIRLLKDRVTKKSRVCVSASLICSFLFIVLLWNPDPYKGKVTFAVPRNVRALGWQKSKPESCDQGDEAPKSNDEFRKMLLKK